MRKIKKSRARNPTGISGAPHGCLAPQIAPKVIYCKNLHLWLQSYGKRNETKKCFIQISWFIASKKPRKSLNRNYTN